MLDISRGDATPLDENLDPKPMFYATHRRHEVDAKTGFTQGVTSVATSAISEAKVLSPAVGQTWRWSWSRRHPAPVGCLPSIRVISKRGPDARHVPRHVPFPGRLGRDRPGGGQRIRSRTWIWGPAPISQQQEPYAEAPGGQRTVVYYDKARMEDNSYRASAPWDVTTGLLAKDLILGQRQTGDTTFEQRAPAEINIAGDQDDLNGPVYRSFKGLLATIQSRSAGPSPRPSIEPATWGPTVAWQVTG